MKKSNIIKWKRNDNRQWFNFEKNGTRFETGLVFGVYGAMQTGKTTIVKKWVDSFLKPEEVLYVVPEESLRETDDYSKYNVVKLSTSLLTYYEYNKYVDENKLPNNRSLYEVFKTQFYDTINIKSKNIKMVVFEELGYFSNHFDDILLIFEYLLSFGVSVTYIMINSFSCIFEDEIRIIAYLETRNHYSFDLPYIKCRCENGLDAEHTEDSGKKSSEDKTPEAFTGRKRYKLFCLECIINKR